MRLRCAITISIVALAALAVPAEAAEAATTVPYTVRWGDTLTWIARDHHIGLIQLARLNRLDPYGILQAGTTIRVPAPAGRRSPVHHARRRAGGARRARVHFGVVVVRPGQTLWSIATAAGTSVSRLAAFNHRSAAAVLPVGLRLRVPAAPAPRRAGHRPAGARPLPHGAIPGLLRYWALRYGIDPRLVLALAWQESGWHTGLSSVTGAQGVMQVMPATWEYVEEVLVQRRLPHTPSGDIHAGVAYLAHLLHSFGGNVSLAVAGYYQGEGAVRAYGILPFSQRYVADVLALRGRM